MLQLEPYNPQWKTEFEKLQQGLTTILKGIPVTIEHVGSTAVPGMIAKPILDIDIIPEKEESHPQISRKLEQAGYIFKGEQGIKGRFAFRQISHLTPISKTGIKWMTHHLYVCFSKSLALKNHLLFRDALLSNRQFAENYLQLKKELLGERGMTREVYNKRKTDFIVSVLAISGLTKNEIVEIKKANE